VPMPSRLLWLTAHSGLSARRSGIRPAPARRGAWPDAGMTSLLCCRAAGSALTFKLVQQPKNGTVTLNAATGSFTWTALPAFQTADRFLFVASDGKIDSNPATVTILNGEQGGGGACCLAWRQVGMVCTCGTVRRAADAACYRVSPFGRRRCAACCMQQRRAPTDMSEGSWRARPLSFHSQSAELTRGHGLVAGTVQVCAAMHSACCGRLWGCL
jgi:hypothetical protein